MFIKFKQICVLHFFPPVRGLGSRDQMRCFSPQWFSRTTDSVVHFLTACPKSVFEMFVADHVDQADIEKCTTGSENSTYSIWETRGIQGSPGESAAFFFFFASGQFEFTPGMEWRNSFLQWLLTYLQLGVGWEECLLCVNVATIHWSKRLEQTQYVMFNSWVGIKIAVR